MKWARALVFAGLLPHSGVRGTDPPPPAFFGCRDDIGIPYVRPYAEALKRAKEADRVLVVKPLGIGGMADGTKHGRW